MMPDFFTRLAGRTLEALPVVRPLINSVYAPARAPTDEDVQTDAGSFFTRQPEESPSLSDSQESPPSVSTLVTRQAAPSFPQVAEASRDATEHESAQPLTGASPNISPPPRRPQTPTVVSSNEDSPANKNQRGASRPASLTKDVQAATEIDAARNREHGVGTGSTDNQGIENRDARTLPEAPAPKRQTSLPRLFVEPEEMRVRTAADVSVEEASPRSEQSTATRARKAADTGSVIAMHDAGSAAGQADESPRTIRVSIGRIEVRALMTPPAPRRIAPPSQSSSLDEYLRSRRGGPER